MSFVERTYLFSLSHVLSSAARVLRKSMAFSRTWSLASEHSFERSGLWMKRAERRLAPLDFVNNFKIKCPEKNGDTESGGAKERREK